MSIPEKLHDGVTAVLGEYDVSYIAPIQGHPIASEDINVYMDAFTESVERVSTDPEIEIY